jgi:hypothetical protein
MMIAWLNEQKSLFLYMKLTAATITDTNTVSYTVTINAVTTITTGVTTITTAVTTITTPTATVPTLLVLATTTATSTIANVSYYTTRVASSIRGLISIFSSFFFGRVCSKETKAEKQKSSNDY